MNTTGTDLEVMQATKPLELVGLPLAVKAVYINDGKYGKYATLYASVGEKQYKTYLSKSNCKACEEVVKALQENPTRKFNAKIEIKQFQNKEGDMIKYASVKFIEPLEIKDGE